MEWTYINERERYRVEGDDYHFGFFVLDKWWEWHRPIVHRDLLPAPSCVCIYRAIRS